VNLISAACLLVYLLLYEFGRPIVKIQQQINAHKLTLLAGMLLMSTQAFSATFGIGFGRSAEFSGSDDYTFTPIASFEVETSVGIFKNDQIGAQLDLIKSGSVDTGPVLRINTGRNDSVSDAVVAALPEIEASPEAGWFVGSGFKLSSLGLTSNAIVIGRLSAVTDMGDGHGGTQVNGSLGLVMPINEKLRFIPSVSFNYADDKYTQAFYGVDGANASADLAEFNASGGIESTQFAIVGIRKINDNWSVTGVGAFNALQGDAAESPITKRGSDTSLFSGLTINYTF